MFMIIMNMYISKIVLTDWHEQAAFFVSNVANVKAAAVGVAIAIIIAICYFKLQVLF